MLGPRLSRLAVNTSYQVLRRVAQIRVRFDDRRDFLGRTRRVAILTAFQRAPVGNDVAVTIPSALGEGSIAPRTTNTATFTGAEARNHASIADEGVASEVIPWILQVEKAQGDLK